jgi:Rieske Fe-S protein
MIQAKQILGRRGFLVGLLTGAGAAAAIAAVVPAKASARREQSPGATAFEPILYQRTEDVERYYRTLYT